MFIDMEKIYNDVQHFTDENWKQVHAEMKQIIEEREQAEKQKQSGK